MSATASLNKVSYSKAAPICEDIDLESQALALLDTEISPIEFLNVLLDKHFHSDAVRFLARALPKREATWWACICARSLLNDASPIAIINALQAAEAWVYHPTDTHRRQAHQAAQATAFDNPAAWAAMAAFWSEGSMAPEEAPVVPPADHLTSKAVAGAVMLSAVLGQPELATQKYLFFIEQGIDIANGGNGKVWQG